MPAYWITFTGRARPGCVVAPGLEMARDIAETKFGEAVRTIDRLPYRASPVLHWEGEVTDGFDPKCTEPLRCKGKMFCQVRPSCSE
jgi:hypothetical protein